MRCASTKIVQPEPRRRSALFRRDVTPTSSAGVALSRSGPRKRAVRWNEPSLLRTTPSSTKAAQGRKSARPAGRLRYSARFSITASDPQMGGIAEVPTDDVDEERIAFGGPDGSRVPDRPEQSAWNPEPEAERDRSRDRAVGDRHGPRCPAHQDWIGERAVDRREEAGDIGIDDRGHQTSAPPEKLKKVRKKLDAAKAIERPNTIWISRRKPPDVSPNARVRPVTVMMITEMILATGPCTDSRMELSGVSQGMEEPEA